MKRLLLKLYETKNLIFSSYPPLELKLNYDHYWNSKRKKSMGTLSSFQETRLKKILPMFSSGKTIKDIGAGEGSILYLLNKKIGFRKAYGIDVSKVSLDSIKEKGLTALKIDFNNHQQINSLPETDYTIVLELLEHIIDAEDLLIKLVKSTRDKLIFSVPNTGFIGHRLRLLFGSFPLQWRLNPSEHLRFWTVRDMKWWLGQLDLLNSSRLIFYEGIPFLNKLFPSIFSQGIIVEINISRKECK